MAGRPLGAVISNYELWIITNVITNTLIRRKSEQWLGLDRQEDRHVQYEQQ